MQYKTFWGQNVIFTWKKNFKWKMGYKTIWENFVGNSKNINTSRKQYRTIWENVMIGKKFPSWKCNVKQFDKILKYWKKLPKNEKCDIKQFEKILWLKNNF